MSIPYHPNAPLGRAWTSLEGLSVGDAFGECFFGNPDQVVVSIVSRKTPLPHWSYTDDTEMALSIFTCLREYSAIDQDALARSFAHHYDPRRSYGASMHSLLEWFRLGIPWQVAAPKLFGGSGSFGNGAAMRVAPVGAFFAEDLEQVIAQARNAALVTHSHPEAVAGAIAVAVATAWASQLREEDRLPSPQEFLEHVCRGVPESLVYRKLREAQNLAPETSVPLAVSVLGNGSRVAAHDTVPFALWCAAHTLDNYEEALWRTVSGLGDRDTTCAIVGGIVAVYTGIEGIPVSWRHAREALPEWAIGS